MEFAKQSDIKEILALYSSAIDKVNTTSVRLGWNIENYPNEAFVEGAISRGEMCILREDGRIVSAAVVNHTVNPEYNDIAWEISGPSDKIATIHALAVIPDKQGDKVSYKMLAAVDDYCKQNGDFAIHLDVIDTNIPAYKFYTRNGYKEIDCIKMYYEVVGTREFWMLEKVL